jgi:hypothetical protein
MMSASAYWFANRSALLAGRANLHNGLMSVWLPHASELAGYLPIQHPAPPASSHAAIDTVVERLRNLRALSA